MEKIPHASAIGSIMYAMLCTKPDMAFALSVMSRFQANPCESHWEAMKCILKYLRRTKDLFLIYGERSLSSRVTLTRVFSQTQMIVDLHLDSCSL